MKKARADDCFRQPSKFATQETFTKEQKEIFEKFHDCWSEYMSLSEASIFEYTFKLGMQIAIETLPINED